MSFRESAFLFRCEGEELVGIVAKPGKDVAAAAVGVLVVVGGPQYRVGSHRQFVLLSRYLAGNGVPCMRFDYRGMGDSNGPPRGFGNVTEDLRAAMDEFFVQVPHLEGVVIWGLCDGASAACFYASLDTRVVGLVLLNPWVKTDAGTAKVVLKHYYLRRLFEKSFWRKLLAGGVSIGKSVGELADAAKQAGRSSSERVDEISLPDRMARGLLRGAVPFVIFLSKRDFVAREFEDVARQLPKWKEVLRAGLNVGTEHFDADHTFSTAKASAEVAAATLNHVRRLTLLRRRPR